VWLRDIVFVADMRFDRCQSVALAAQRWAVPALVALFMSADVASLRASIVQAPLAVDANAAFEMFADSGSCGAGSSSAPSSDPTPDKRSQENEHWSYANLESPTGSTSTTSSTSQGGFSGGAMPFIESAVWRMQECQSFARLTVFSSLFIPAPPGVELLRPPQTFACSG
jgi:hypothetical protein